MQTEIWKDVPGYEGQYQVSNLGNVRSIRVLSKINHSKGYHQINMMVDSKLKIMKIHQLVAMAFLDHVPNGNKLVVDHINGDKKDNRLENLQVITNGENLRRAYEIKIIDNMYKKKTNKSSRFPGVCFFKQTGKWKAQFQRKNVRKHLGYFDTEMEAYHAYQIEKYSLAQ